MRIGFLPDLILFSRLIRRTDRSTSQPISKQHADPRHNRLMDLRSLFSRRPAHFVVVVLIDLSFRQTKREKVTLVLNHSPKRRADLPWRGSHHSDLTEQIKANITIDEKNFG